jgi:arsenate reductase
MSHRMMNVLFLCTANSARSILAEAILAKRGAGRFRSFSAGSHPRGIPNPMALEVLAEEGHDISALRSKSWDEFAGEGAPAMDFIFTVCDSAAGETCPVWIGHPTSAHWGIPDPAGVEGNHIEVKRAFVEAYKMLDRRISTFVALPFASLDAVSLRNELRTIGRMDGATEMAKGDSPAAA